MKVRECFAVVLLFSWASGAATFTQTSTNITLHYAFISPIIAVLAGVLILIVPRLMNYFVAVYLILVGLIGIFAR
jgi:hypothetical protein